MLFVVEMSYLNMVKIDRRVSQLSGLLAGGFMESFAGRHWSPLFYSSFLTFSISSIASLAIAMMLSAPKVIIEFLKALEV